MANGKPHDKAQRNFTDPESRILKTGDGYLQGYNAQIAVCAHAQVIVAHGLSNPQNDSLYLPVMVRRIKESTGRQARELSTQWKVVDEHSSQAGRALRLLDALRGLGTARSTPCFTARVRLG